MTRLLVLAVVVGCACVAAGVALISPPVGLIVAGVELAAGGLLVNVEDDDATSD